MSEFIIGNKESWEKLLKTFNESTGLAMSLTDAGGGILLHYGDRNQLCSRIREDTDSLRAVCSQTNTAMTQQVKQVLEPVLEICEAGLLRIAVPIVREGELIGQVTGCGLAGDLEEIDPFFISMQLGIDEKEVAPLMESVKTTTDEEMKATGQLILKAIKGLN